MFVMNPYIYINFFFPFMDRLLGTNIIRCFPKHEENQWKNNQEVKLLQLSKLKRLLLHCHKTVPYYRQLFTNIGIERKHIDSLECFFRIPFLSKKDINENRDKIRSSKLDYNRLIPNSTSGSTGESLFFYMDKRSFAHQEASTIRNQKWLGIYPGDKTAKLWGEPMQFKRARSLKGRVLNWAKNVLFLSSYELYDERMKHYAKKLTKFKPIVLISYPGPLAVFSEYLLKKRIRIPSIRSIISSAETLFPWQRDIIVEAFSCPVYNRYGCREFGDIAHECPKQEGLHINADRVFLELIDKDSKPVTPGETGEVVITDLDNYGFPFVRYRTGDLASWGGGDCSCGRGFSLLKSVEGRTMDIIRAPNGNRLGGTFWTILFRSRPGIRAFQVFQKKIDEITVRYVKDEDVGTVPIEFFIERIKTKCGPNLLVRFEKVSKIPTTIAGKTRFVVSKLESFD